MRFKHMLALFVRAESSYKSQDDYDHISCLVLREMR